MTTETTPKKEFSPTGAIMRFLNKPGFREDLVYHRVTAREMKELKDRYTDAEYSELGRQANSLL